MQCAIRELRRLRLDMTTTANKITGANAGGPRWLPIRTRWAARIAQFWCWAILMDTPYVGL